MRGWSRRRSRRRRPTGPGRTSAGSSRNPCMPANGPMLRAVSVLALVLLSACGTMAKWHQSQQAQQAASAHRQQTEEAAAINSESKQDRAAKLQRAQHDERLRRLQAELAARADADSLAASALFARELAEPATATPLDLAA